MKTGVNWNGFDPFRSFKLEIIKAREKMFACHGVEQNRKAKLDSVTRGTPTFKILYSPFLHLAQKNFLLD